MTGRSAVHTRATRSQGCTNPGTVVMVQLRRRHPPRTPVLSSAFQRGPWVARAAVRESRERRRTPRGTRGSHADGPGNAEADGPADAELGLEVEENPARRGDEEPGDGELPDDEAQPC